MILVDILFGRYVHELQGHEDGVSRIAWEVSCLERHVDRYPQYNV